jgi:translation elongation factor EF-Ts
MIIDLEDRRKRETDLFELTKRLYQETRRPVLECRMILLEINNDYDKAKQILNERTFQGMKRFGGVLDG